MGKGAGRYSASRAEREQQSRTGPDWPVSADGPGCRENAVSIMPGRSSRMTAIAESMRVTGGLFDALNCLLAYRPSLGLSLPSCPVSQATAGRPSARANARRRAATLCDKVARCRQSLVTSPRYTPFQRFSHGASDKALLPRRQRFILPRLIPHTGPPHSHGEGQVIPARSGGCAGACPIALTARAGRPARFDAAPRPAGWRRAPRLRTTKSPARAWPGVALSSGGPPGSAAPCQP